MSAARRFCRSPPSNLNIAISALSSYTQQKLAAFVRAKVDKIAMMRWCRGDYCVNETHAQFPMLLAGADVALGF
jgi:hypothetical protein